MPFLHTSYYGEQSGNVKDRGKKQKIFQKGSYAIGHVDMDKMRCVIKE